MSDPILSVHNLVGGYGKMTILNGTTFSVPQATITTIIGWNSNEGNRYSRIRN